MRLPLWLASMALGCTPKPVFLRTGSGLAAGPTVLLAE